jgi:hypothetical protein
VLTQKHLELKVVVMEYLLVSIFHSIIHYSIFVERRAEVEITRQQAEADKARLDFELVRLLKCGEAIKAGVTYHPDSPYAKICADVVVRYPSVKEAAARLP